MSISRVQSISRVVHKLQTWVRSQDWGSPWANERKELANYARLLLGRYDVLVSTTNNRVEALIFPT